MSLTIDGNKVLPRTAYVFAATDRSGWGVKVKLDDPPRFNGDNGKPGPIIGDGTLIVGVYEKRQNADAVQAQVYLHGQIGKAELCRKEIEKMAGVT